MEYKVLTERDKRFSGSFDPESLEQALNGYAAEGWRRHVIVGGTHPGAYAHPAECGAELLEASVGGPAAAGSGTYQQEREIGIHASAPLSRR